MEDRKGYIYFRDNNWYKIENVIKMGITSSIKDRANTYITGEVKGGEYVSVIEIPLNKMKIIDTCLKYYFKSYNIYYSGGGTEFYHKNVVDLIKNYLKQMKLEYKFLTKEEILLLNRCERLRNIPNIDKIKNIFNQLNIKNIIQKYKIKRSKYYSIKPNNHQQHILEIIEHFFVHNNIGKIVWACGLGKALLSILIVKLLNFKSVLIGVPSNNLQQQIKNEILKIFPNKNNILFVGGDKNDDVETTANKMQIIHFLNDEFNTDTKFIISTYHSCHLLVNVNITFEFKIGDEAHHLVGIEKEQNKGFRLFHKIISLKTLFMTATEKNIENQTTVEMYTMDDETIFGKYIDKKSVYWAIENKKITDYNILVLKNTEDEVDEIIRTLKINAHNKEIFISCYMCLKSFEKYNDLTHLLLYTNTIADAELSTSYINKILSINILSISRENIYNNFLHSKNCDNLNDEVCKFKHSIYGIISCVYIFGEGFDLPKLNGVCIAGNMQSETRIVQYLLRPNRLDFENPNKKAYIIIPYIDSDDWETENNSHEKVRNIILQMRNIDENIEQKIKLCVGKIKNKEFDEQKINNQIMDECINYDFEENVNELYKLKLRLKYSKALSSKFTEEQDEYNYIRSINSNLNIKSKKEYILNQHIHNNFIPNPEEYFKLKGVWINWYDFIGVNTSQFIQSKQDWINFCKEKNIKTLNDYCMCCEKYNILPKEPADFYKDFTNISRELGFNLSRR